MKIAIISTSPREGSNSLKVARYLKKVLAEKGYTDSLIFDFRKNDIPLVGRGEVDPANLTAAQKDLVDTWGDADVVVFIVPEYNWLTGGELINALHQLGSHHFKHLFNDKVFAMAGVSTGRGGRRPCLELTTLVNKLISFLHVHSVISPKLFESHETNKQLTEDGISTGNPVYEKGLSEFVDYTLTIAKKWHHLS